MKWVIPPLTKVYEALGTVADGRVEIEGDSGKVFSSSGNKFYTITYDPKANAIMSNDNSSYYVGYLGYPALAFLMVRGVITYDATVAESLKGIPWKDMNQKNRNDFEKTVEEVKKELFARGFDVEALDEEAERIHEVIKRLELNRLGNKVRPPEGY